MTTIEKSPIMNKGGSRDKSVQEKLRQIFGISKSPALPEFSKYRAEVYVIDNDILKDLGCENPISQRLKAVRELIEPVLNKTLQDKSIECLCLKTKDLLQEHNPTEARHTIWRFYSCIASGQYDKLDMTRGTFFQLLVHHDNQEDLLPRLDLLHTLTNGGKDILYLEEEMGKTLVHLLTQVIAFNKALNFLPYLLTLIKYNSAYLSKYIISQIVKHICMLCHKTSSDETIQQCLEVLDAIICYSHLPQDILEYFVSTLCLVIKFETLNEDNWKVMNNLLGTSLGHSSLYYLCSILKTEKYYSEHLLMKGALFHIKNFICNRKKVSNLIPSYQSILSALLQALDSRTTLVGHHVMLILRCYLKKSSQDINVLEWNLMLEILDKILSQADIICRGLAGTQNDFTALLSEILVAILSHPHAQASQENIFSIIDNHSTHCPELVVLDFLEYKFHNFYPYKENWLENLQSFLEKYYKNEVRVPVRIKVIDLFSNLIHTLKYSYEEILMDQAVLHFFSSPELEPCANLRVALVQFLTSLLLHSCVKRYVDVLDLLEKILCRPFMNLRREDIDLTISNEELEDIVVAVSELINIFKKNIIYGPASQALIIFKLLTEHLNDNYSYISSMENATKIRKMIIGFLSTIKWNKFYQLGLTDSPSYSPYIICAKKPDTGPATLSPTSPGASSTFGSFFLNMDLMFQSFILCLKQEKDCTILLLLLNNLPHFLYNKVLVTKDTITAISSHLCSMLADKSPCDSLKNLPPKFTKTDFHSCILPSLGSLVIYNTDLEPSTQRVLINRLQADLIAMPMSISILTACLLELQYTMMRLLPNILLNFSKISATTTIALPILEFLMMLQQLPNLYCNFVEDQYMSIFAITLPYTNPFKFSTYVAFLAHRLIIIWFLKCRIPFRKDFAHYIIKGLIANMIKPFDEHSTSDALIKNKSASTDGSHLKIADKQYYIEVLEVTLDLMSRFTFGHSTNQPKRSYLAEFLLEKGQSQSWIVDNKIITVTTSGCGLKSFKNGVCEKCSLSCKSSPIDVFSELKVNVKKDRRRHKSAHHFPQVSHIQMGYTRSQDDLQLVKTLNDRLPSMAEGATPDGTQSKTKPGGSAFCNCWCVGWAEIFVHHPTGNSSWMMRIQNRLFLPTFTPELYIPDLASILQIEKPKEHFDNSEEPKDVLGTQKESEVIPSQDTFVTAPADGTPLRRTNSSPEMSAESPPPPFTKTGDNIDEALSSKAYSSLSSKDEKEKKEFSRSNLSLELHHTNAPSQPISIGSPQKPPSPPAHFGRDRGHTISVMSPIQSSKVSSPSYHIDSYRSGLSPSYVFLQFYQKFNSSLSKPLPIPRDEAMQRSLKMLDHILPYENHKIGVVYVGPGQAKDEAAFMCNTGGSLRYTDFIQKLGTTIVLKDVDPRKTYLGGLDPDTDGKFGVIYHDDIFQVVFHIATLIPTKVTDPKGNNKKLHIANDYVCIVYNESEVPFEVSTIKSQFISVCLDVWPQNGHTSLVWVRARPELAQLFGHTGPLVLTDGNLPALVRQWAVQASLLCQIHKGTSDPYLSTWHARLARIKKLYQKVQDLVCSQEEDSTDTYVSNFTHYL